MDETNKPMFELNVFAELFHFFLQDDHSEADLSDEWDDEAMEQMVAVQDKVIGIATVRDLDVPVIIEIQPAEPKDEDLSEWDHVVDCSVALPSGVLVVSGPTEDFLSATRINVTPGTYRARVYFGMLAEVDEDGFEGDDFYKIRLWPGEKRAVKVIKQWEPVPARI